ncbi:MAG: hypothetical protein WC718_15905 [Phycisphaerales bacterium]|jgi:hypothetical protein
MANDKRIRNLTAATGLAGTDFLVVDQGSGAAVRASVSDVIAAGGGVIYVRAALSASNTAAANATALQAACDAAFAQDTGGTVIVPGGDFTLTSLNLSQPVTQDLTKHVRIVGDTSQGSILRFASDGVCIDAVGADNVRFENLSITNAVGSTPTVGLLLGRTTAAANCRWLSARNVRVEGSFSQACVASIAAEIQHWDTCIFWNNHATGVAYYTSTQPIGIHSNGSGGYAAFTVASANGTLLTSSNTDITFTKCAFITGGAYGIPLSVEAGLHAQFYGCEFDPYGANAAACVLLSAELNNVCAGPLLFSGCLFESATAHGIVLYAGTGLTKEWRGFKIIGNYFNLYGTGQQSLTWTGALTDANLCLTSVTYRDNTRPILANDSIRINYVQDADIDVGPGTIVFEKNGTAAATYVDSKIHAANYTLTDGPTYVGPTRSRREWWANAAPGSGDHLVGDVVWNSEVASGEYIGFVCTTAGSPGTWKGFGAIA